MQRTRMVRLATVSSTFHARVIAARLGAEGIVTELRGNVDGIYPMGECHVLVDEGDVEQGRELLLADEVESAFDGPNDEDAGRRAPPQLWVLLVAVVVLAALALTWGH